MWLINESTYLSPISWNKNLTYILLHLKSTLMLLLYYQHMQMLWRGLFSFLYVANGVGEATYQFDSLHH